MNPPADPQPPRPTRPPRRALAVSAQTAPGVLAHFAPLAVVRQMIRRALPLSEFPRGGEVAIRFAAPREIAEWNQKFRGKSEPTDVLSFPYETENGRVLGDIAICPDIVRQNARRDGADFAAMMAHAVVHGALHLAGRRHDNPENARKMANDEARILNAFGFDRPNLF